MKSNILWIDQIKDRDGSTFCIYDLAFSADNNSLLVAADNKVYVYDISDGTLVQTLKGHKDTVLSIAISHDGKRFATGSSDKQVIIWTSKMEGILKYSHNDSIKSLQYNPKSHQLLSCTAIDFGLWSPEQKTVSKTKITSAINCCAWNSDGNLFALGLNNGVVSIRFKSGEEKLKIDRNGAIWALVFHRFKNTEVLTVSDWSKSLSRYDLNNLDQNRIDRTLTFDPLFVSLFAKEAFFLLGGCDRKISLYSLDGVYLDTLGIQNSWIWCCKANQNKFAIGCQDGSLAVYDVTFLTVHSLYKERYAFRDSMTDVVIQHLITGEKVRIKCRDLVRKIAIYQTTLAIQLSERVVLYEAAADEASNGMNYKIKEKINTKIDCSLLVLCSHNLILCQEKRLQSLQFTGQLEKEWLFEAPIRYIKTIGGVPKQEGLLIGLKNGQVIWIFLSNFFHINLLKLTNSIRCIDLSMKRQKIAIIDDKNKCSVFEINTKKLIYEETNVTSIAWNSNYEDLLCVAGQSFLGIKTTQFPMQLINNEYSNKSFVIGYAGSMVITLQSNKVVSQQISYSKLLFLNLERCMFEEAYRIACLNVTREDWRTLTNVSLSRANFKVARKCLVRMKDWLYLDLIQSQDQTINSDNEKSVQLFLAKLYSYRGLFSEAAKLYRKLGYEHLAEEMFNDLQMYEQAKEYQKDADKGMFVMNESRPRAVATSTTASATSTSLKDLETMSKLYISNGELSKAIQLIEKTNSDSIMAFVGQLDKGETRLLTLIAEHLANIGELDHAIAVHKKMGDFKNLALVYIKAKQWNEAFKIATDFPQLKQDIYLPYAHWLAENERFIEAQQAFTESGHPGESYRVLDRLLTNSVNENRFGDASYYCWLLGNHCQKTNQTKRAEILHQHAQLYYTYHLIYKYVEEPFTSVYADVLFNAALYLFHFIEDDFPSGVSKANILFALTKLGKSLGHYKLVRIAYKKLQNLRLPDKLEELIEIGSVEIQTKPFVDAEDLALFCYRCSATNSLFNSKHNRCVNCHQPFVQSFYSFVEFELHPNLSDEQAAEILVSKTKRAESGQNRTNDWTPEVIQDGGSQMPEVYTNEIPSGDFGETTATANDRVRVFNYGDEVNSATELVMLDEGQLNKVTASSVIMTNEMSGGEGGRRCRYYLNMMPEIGITACEHCHKFFYSDEFEFQILKNGKCLFCRN